jgi:creatinine amidohydrolase
MNWRQVEDYLRRDDRAVVPVGSTEQHGYLSLSVDSILSERVAVEAAEPLGVPVFPVLAYGLTPYFLGFPGTVSLRLSTYAAVLRDLLDSLRGHGFKRILLCNGHGGNQPGQTAAMEWMNDHPGHVVRWHNWWNAPRTWAVVQAIDPVASHASWMENFPWTRIAEVELPAGQKPMIDVERMRLHDRAGVREFVGDGNYGGVYQRSDEEMQAIWDAAVAETRDLIGGPWS